MIAPSELWSVLKRAAAEWWDDNVSRLASSLAYYTVFSIAPLLVIAIAISGAVFGAEAAQNEVSSQLRGLLGPAGAEVVELTVKNAGQNQASGALASILGILVLAWGATNVFISLQDSLNTIWGVKPRPDIGLWNTVRIRFLSFGMVLGFAFLLLVSLLVSAALSALERYFDGARYELVWQGLNTAISIGVFSLLFAMIFKFLPDVKVGWRDVAIGAVATAALFSIGKTLIGLYLGHSSVGSVYGAAGSLVILLLWVYYSAQVLFFGAEFTQVYARRHGRHIAPDSHAVAITEDELARQGIPRPETVQDAVEAKENAAAGRTPSRA
jgi:membrane protein